MNSVELLAPAGDLERLKFAYLYGADAVYIGGKNFSLRANAKNFSIDEIKEAVNIAHNLGKKLYVTVNIVFHNDDLKGLKEYLEELSDIKVDAIIVSDIVVMDIINKNNIDLEVHLSTQASTLNASSAKFYLQQGVKRLVLAREASKEDIINILSNLSIKFYIIMSVIVLIWIFILMTISTITDVLVIATMGYIISKIINKQFTFTNIFNIAIHAITLSVLLGGIYYIINSLTGFYMKYFSIMYTSIAIIYIMTSILLITSDNNENNNIQDD